MVIPLSYEFRNDEELLPPRPKAGDAVTYPILPDSYTRLERLNYEMSLPTLDPAIRKALEAEWLTITRLGVSYRNQQKKFAGHTHDEAREKHAQWLKWQAEAIAESPKLAKLSKDDQAVKLKKKHKIKEMHRSISKRLKDTRCK